MTPSLNYKNVTKRFGAKTVLNEVSFAVTPLKTTFILGKSGTGKSVLIKCAVGLEKPDHGSITFGNHEITKCDESDLVTIRRQMAVVFQNPALFDSLNVFNNIAYGVKALGKNSPEEIKQKVQSVCRELQMPLSILKCMPFELSFGYQKIVSLARTLILKPHLIMFDEPTTGLDPSTTAQVNSMIENLKYLKKTTLLIISHDVHSALKLADEIIFLDSGKILLHTTTQRVLESTNPLIQDFLYDIRRVKE